MTSDNNVMKLALLVLGCFVCVTKQERYVWPFPIDPNHAVYKPLYYSDGLPAGYDVIKKSDGIQQNKDVIPRNPGALLLPQQNRFFVNANSIYLFTMTTTIKSTVTSTATTAAVVKCIPSTQLSATTACARRRRDTEEKVVIGNDDIVIKPDPPKPLETSVMSDDVPEAAPSVALPDIASSQRELETGEFADHQQRAAFTTTVSVTSLTTTFVFVATSITSTTSLGISAGLLCLPSGFTICA
ncbi:uncharacterized protein LOC123467753 [Daphnia magna]|uniref:uncharacterized protein LOC123467753 n=1 Tax=Daphnia magna TaxID=35525 RepID=UPI001E1BCC47|nr:uncharacterized protein LOC123467753 [Daphnia magna]